MRISLCLEWPISCLNIISSTESLRMIREVPEGGAKLKPVVVFFEALVEWADDPRRWIRLLRQVGLTLGVIGVPYACSSLYHDNAQRHVDAALDMALEDCALNRMVVADAHTLPQYKACVKSLVRRYGQ
ncbi:hypothetical protein [Azotobacter chroococcum]|uniref:hypothetical protein n=1 Tax=Azotobacter chroococcum TaxID=353 RepID=UPI001F0EAD4A|nr:hypothetical protein [Azotobacter chroococcum]